MSAAAQGPTGPGGAGQSRFQRTISYLQQSDPAGQAEFAAVALAELAAVYVAEADLARAQAAERQGARRARLLGWSQAVDQYAALLLRVLDDVEQELPVVLRSGQPSPASIAVAGTGVILGHPRPDQQAAYEQRVLSDYCGRHDCQQMTVPDVAAEPIPVSAGRVKPLWAFTDNGLVCSVEGLEVHFQTSSNLAVMRGICEELVQEMASLASEIAWQVRHGVEIEWAAIAVTATPGRTEHLVRLNSAGDSVLLAIPLLSGQSGLLADVTPWLSATAAGKKPDIIRLDASNYGWLAPAF